MQPYNKETTLFRVSINFRTSLSCCKQNKNIQIIMKFPSQNGRTNWEMTHYEFLSLTSFVLSCLSSHTLSLQPNTIKKLGVDSIQNICCLVNPTYLNFFVEQVISPFGVVLKVPLCKRFSAPVFVRNMWIVPVTAPMKNSTVCNTHNGNTSLFSWTCI